MSKKMFMSVEKSFHLGNPVCFRCGDCCMRLPAEVTKEEIELIGSRLNLPERKLFEESLTTDPAVADPIDVVRVPLSKAAWIKAPCCFLYFEKGRKHGKNVRSACRIYKIRPEICRVFHCGKDLVDEPLLPSRYEYELTSKFTAFVEEEVRKTSGDKGVEDMKQMILKAERTEKNGSKSS